jgi:hypothetical protein
MKKTKKTMIKKFFTGNYSLKFVLVYNKFEKKAILI